MRTTKKPQFFVPGGSKDTAFLQRIATESSDLFNREILVKFLDRARTKYDPLYGESKNLIFDPFFVRANVELTPKKATLTKMGLDEPRDLIVMVNVGILQRGSGPLAEVGDDDPYATERGGYPVPEPGDMFEVEGEDYKILDQPKQMYLWHTEEHTWWGFGCERARPRSVDDAVPVDPVANPTGPTEFKTNTDTDFPGEGL